MSLFFVPIDLFCDCRTQMSRDKHYRASLMKSRFYDTIIKSHEMTLNRGRDLNSKKGKKWWWKAFAFGLVAVYIFFYSANYLVFDLKGLSGIVSATLYFGYLLFVISAIMLATAYRVTDFKEEETLKYKKNSNSAMSTNPIQNSKVIDGWLGNQIKAKDLNIFKIGPMHANYTRQM